MFVMLRVYAVFTFACALLIFFGLSAARAIGSMIPPAEGVILYVAHTQFSPQRDLYALDAARGLVVLVMSRTTGGAYNVLQQNRWLFFVANPNSFEYAASLVVLRVDASRAHIIERREIGQTNTVSVGGEDGQGWISLSTGQSRLLFARFGPGLFMWDLESDIRHTVWEEEVSAFGWAAENDSRIAFIAVTNYGNHFLCLANIPSLEVNCGQQFLNVPSATGLVWSAQHDLIAYACGPIGILPNYGVCLVDPDERIPPRRIDLPCTGSMRSAPSWSPDGTQLLAACSNGNEVSQVYRVDLATGEEVRLLQTPTDNHSPVWVRH